MLKKFNAKLHININGIDIKVLDLSIKFINNKDL